MNQELRIMEITLNKEKFKIFLEVVKMLNQEFGVEPILFGSLGLNRVIGEHWKSNDIDLLIPDKIKIKELKRLKSQMEKIGFILKDEYEYDFCGRDEVISFGRIGSLDDIRKIIGEEIDNMQTIKVDGVKFKEFTPKQYLLFYSEMLRDKYRQEKRGDEDKEKIKKIEDFLRSSS